MLLGDANLQNAVKESAHNVLFAISQSNLMNRYNSTTRIENQMTWWWALYLGLIILFAVLAVVCGGLYVLASKKADAMAELQKKRGAAVYFNVIAAVLGIAGMIAMIVSSSIASAYALSGIPILVIAVILGVYLIVLSLYAFFRWGNHNCVSAVSIIAAIALFICVFGNTVSQRVMMVAGLLTYNSMNTNGWSVFYASVVSWGCFLVVALCLIIGAFLKSVRESNVNIK